MIKEIAIGIGRWPILHNKHRLQIIQIALVRRHAQFWIAPYEDMQVIIMVPHSYTPPLGRAIQTQPKGEGLIEAS